MFPLLLILFWAARENDAAETRRREVEWDVRRMSRTDAAAPPQAKSEPVRPTGAGEGS